MQAMKRYGFWFFVIIMLIIFKYTIYSFFIDTSVQNHKYYSLFVSDINLTNGYESVVFEQPYFKFSKKNNQVNWEDCNKINKILGSYLKNWHQVKKPYKFVSEVYPSGYKAYIKTLDTIIFVRGFPDFGGVPPTEEEKKICE